MSDRDLQAVGALVAVTAACVVVAAGLLLAGADATAGRAPVDAALLEALEARTRLNAEAAAVRSRAAVRAAEERCRVAESATAAASAERDTLKRT